MNWKFWKPATIGSELDETQIKVLSRFILNQKDVITDLTESNMQLVAEVQVLREVVNDLRSINNISVNKAIKLREASRKTSPFNKNK